MELSILLGSILRTSLYTIKNIEKGESKRSTARNAGITRTTVKNIVERKQLYMNFSNN